jgi:hypothetical protein
MSNQAERKIFDMIEAGQITAEEGLRLINAMAGSQNDPADQDVTGEVVDSTKVSSEDILEAPSHPIPEEEMQRMKKLKRWWVLPFGLGLLITILGSIWMVSGYMNSGLGWGFWLAWLPFLLGIGVMAVSFRSSQSVWVHVRVKQKPGEKPQQINISLPLPVTITRWVFSTFGDRIPGLTNQQGESISEIIKNLSPDEPFYVHVDEDDGEEVEVFIG